ncbi:glycoside hydrolase family 2 TIM barrel-domain containing protein [Pseudochryseolinea flava]|uniref:Beta-galactosidase n=1 Tax=Pseudochryseolinea flava TaxID=2059302 RepID=A0A364Y8Q3_9BACT|nr:glycoside hydrolase family 2 TIM barrel-domain containing protein [Pseudochryseolinea flava]RAW02230.1 glycoside hydrolase family 2 [Pseudochryseolinea flava]
MDNIQKYIIACLIVSTQAFASTIFAQTVNALTEIQYLSGRDNRSSTTWDFWCTGGRNSGKWTKIIVPSHWEQQGFGEYNYGRDYVTYGKNFKFEEEKGIYRHTFTVPKTWKNKLISIVFEGSMTDTEVKINGKLAGPIHQGSFYRFSYDITDKLKPSGNNILEVTVSKMSTDKSVNNAERLADYWIFGGIFRPVYLQAVPREHIEWTSIDAKADGTFAMRAYVNNLDANTNATAEIIDKRGKILTTVTATRTDSTLHFKDKISNPLCWTAETPNLYTIRVTLQKGSRMIHQVTDKFGFRTIAIRSGDGIYVNDVKIKMKGVNRHVWWPETGRTINRNIDLNDVLLMKEMNMNAVRCSHYPPDKSFLRICDSLGLYVIDELAGWQKAYSTETGLKLVKEMVIRDVNHPSIIFWSNGNEGGHNKELDDDYHLYDLSKRPVIHAHHRPGNHFNGIDCNHYEDYYSTKKILNDSLIYMPTEFLHAQDDGGGAAALEDFWELHWQEKRGAGGFLWALVDEGLVRTDFPGVVDVNGVNAPDGILGPHRQKEGSFYAIRQIYSPVKISMKSIPDNFNGQIQLENRFHFTSLDQCSFKWSLLKFSKPFQTTKVDTINTGALRGPSILPLHSGQLNISLPLTWKDADALRLVAYDDTGTSICEWTWTVSREQKIVDKIINKDSVSSIAITESDSTLALKANGITIVLSKRNGQLIQLENDFSAKLSFANGPILTTGINTLKHFKHYSTHGAHVAEASFDGNLKYCRWKMTTSGWVELEYEYHLQGTYPFAGISFNYPENFILGVKWLGKGPYRVWKNRMHGTLGIWEKRNNGTHTGSAPWLYPEFKGYHADVQWMEFNTVEGKFLVVAKEKNLTVRLFDFYALSGKRMHPALPPGDISFLDYIPPTGTKLALNINTNTKNLGPNSEQNVIDAPIKRSLYFFFGLPKSNDSEKQFTMPSVNVLTD